MQKKSISDYEISIIKALIKLKIKNQIILGCINNSYGDVENHINLGRITDIKNRKIGADIPPASEKEAKSFIRRWKNPNSSNEELDKILQSQGDFLIEQESEILEFKSSFHGYKNDKILKNMQGMANNKGGYILFGIEDKGKILGISEKEQKEFNCDAKEITQAISSNYPEEIEWRRHTEEIIKGKKICILQVFESKNKPIIAKSGEIFYRYSGESKKIQKAELTKIIEECKARKILPTFYGLIEKILKNGIENSAILNIATGDVEGKGGSFLIDESLLPNIAFIKEGEFVETKGAPALILKGEIKPYNAIVKTEQKVNIGDSRVYECFFKSEELAPDEAKEYLNGIACSPIELFPIRFFAQKAGMSKEKIIEYLKNDKDGNKIEKKIKKLEKNQPERLKIASTIECEKFKKEDLSSLANRGGEIGKWLESIQSYDDQTIRNEKEFLLRLIQKLYEHCKYHKKEDPLLLSKVRKTIVYLDKVLYPLD